MSDQRDWDKELAEIDRMLAKGGGAAPAGPPALPAKAGAPGGAPTEPRAAAPRPVPSGGRRPLAVWLITLLAPLGAAALTIWPYPKACGTMLYVYLAAVLGVIAAAVWAMHTAWHGRRGLAMTVGVLALLFALGLLAAEVLPRTGYAATTLHWTCSS